MAVVDVQLTPRPLADDEVREADIDDVMADDTCSCSAGDDNPH
ncbi:hypothetical protein ACGFNU_05685 [Spirillospora sp. NPDC048911]